MKASLAAMEIANLLHRFIIGSALVHHHNVRAAIAFHRFLEEFQCCSFVALLQVGQTLHHSEGTSGGQVTINPEPDAFMADVYPALVQKILHIPQ
jgi:hypothetical protein